MKQQTLAVAADKGAGFEQYRKPTKRDVFLQTMNEIMPWAQLCEVVRPHYPKGEVGRPPIELERMLRMNFVQHWLNLADDACEEALLDSVSPRRFVGIDLARIFHQPINRDGWRWAEAVFLRGCGLGAGFEWVFRVLSQ